MSSTIHGVRQLARGVQALVHGDACLDQRDLVAAAGPQHLASADREGLPRRVEDRPGALVVRR